MSRDYIDDLHPAVELTEVDPPYRAGPTYPHGDVLHAPAEPLDPNPTPTTPFELDANQSAPDRSDTVPPIGPRQAEDHTRRGRRRFLPRTLTGRLVAGVVVLVVLVVLVTSTATYFALHSFLQKRLDQQVEQVASSNQFNLQQCIIRNRNPCNFGPGGSSAYRAPQKQWLALLDPSGKQIAQIDSSPDLLPMQLSTDQSARLISNPPDAATVVTSDGEKLRITSRVVTAGSENVLVVTGLSTSDMDRTAGQLLRLDLLIGASAVLIALVATAYGVRLSLRPLRRVTRTAQEVTAELSPEGAGLDRRVPVTDADTEVGQVAQSVNTLLGAVETQFAARVQSEDRMRQFLADASHELRTPLTSIRGYAELARMRRANGDDTVTDGDTLGRIESEGTRMSRLVDDLLLLARSDRGAAPQHEPVDVGELVADAVDGARASFPNRRIDAIVPTPLIIDGDRDQLLRVLRNLVTNAAVHTAPSGPIRVSVHADGDEVVMQIADSGPGLPPEDAAHVFERFWRADKARTRARGGSGLGLAIVASIVQAHGGTVSFDSSVATGSTVTVRLPGASRLA